MIDISNINFHKTQIKNISNLNAFESEQRLIAIADKEGNIEIFYYKEIYNKINHKELFKLNQKINFAYKNEILMKINFLPYQEQFMLTLTNHGRIQIWDLKQNREIIQHNLNYRTVSCTQEDLGSWMMVGFGYDWSQGIEGASFVDYKPQLGFFDTEDLFPKEIEFENSEENN